MSKLEPKYEVMLQNYKKMTGNKRSAKFHFVME